MKHPLTHHPFTQLITLVIIMLASLFVFSFLGLLLAIPLFDLSLQDFFQDLSSGSFAENIMLFKYLQSIQSIGLFVFPPFAFAWLYSRHPVAYLKIDAHPDLGSMIYVIVIIFVGMPFIGYLGELNQSMDLPEALKGIERWMSERESSAREITQRFLRAENTRDLMLNIFMIGILPAIGEELVFRGVFQRILLKWTRNTHWAVLITAIAFSAMHIQFYGFLPRFFLGVLFGYFMVWGRTVWLPVLAHFVNNTAAVVYYYFMQKQGITPQTEFSGYDLPISIVIFSLGGIFLFGYLMYNNERKLREQ